MTHSGDQDTADRQTAWRAAWQRRPAFERWLISLAAGFASGLGRLALVSMRGLIWRAAAGVIGIAGMGWLLTDATRALMAEAQPGTIVTRVDSTVPAPNPVRTAVVTGTLPAGRGALSAPEWIAEQPRRMSFELRLREVAGEPLHHSARRERSSGVREEVITAGRFGGEGPWLVMSLARANEPTASLAVTLARRASERGITLVRSANPGALATKFGPIEAADITLGGTPLASEGIRSSRADGNRACIAFRHAPDDVALTITGWFCGPSARPADRAAMACLIERIGVTATGDDPALRQHFARAELNRQSACNPAHLHAAGRRTTWLDPASSLPPLRPGAS